MKKIYITPAMVVAMAATTNIMTTSEVHNEQGSGEQLSKGTNSSMWENMDEEEK